MAPFPVAVIQDAPVAFDRDATLAKVRTLTAAAAGTGAKLVPGPACTELATIARENAVMLVIGVIERDAGTLYCTVLFFDPSGVHYARPDIFRLEVNEHPSPPIVYKSE